MQLASRMSKLSQEGAFAVLAKAQELERKGEKIIHLEIGQPDFKTPDHIAKAGIEAIKEGKTKYTSSLGIYSLRNAIAEYLSSRYKMDVSSNLIAVTPSCKTALFTAIASVVEPGDEVMYPDPGFPAYKILIQFFGGKAIPIPLSEERNFSFDMSVLRKKFNKKTKAIILSYPSNPTGSILRDDDLKEISELTKKTNTWIITDEIYSRLIYSEKPYKSIYSFPRMKDRTIVVDGFSKTYSMTGWRLGYLLAPKFIMQKVDYFLTHSVACTAMFTQEAGVTALKESQKEVDKMVGEFKKRRDIVVKMLNEIKGVTCVIPQGAFYVFPNVKSFGRTSKEIADFLLEDAKVALLDGTSFGEYGEGYLRISYSASIDKLTEGIKRISKSLIKLN